MPCSCDIFTTLNRGLIFLDFFSVFSYFKKAQPGDCCEINNWKKKFEIKKVQ